jgi:uncharacterized membrane protein
LRAIIPYTIMTEKHSSRHIIPKERIGNVIDAIYAFSMTLLVTTISVPPKAEHSGAPEPVLTLVSHLLPDLMHYFIAFVILATFWYFEHQRFRHLRHLDRPLLCLNIAGLAFVCLLPFTTDVAGDFPFDNFGAILFELNILFIGMIAFVQWIYIRTRRDELVPELTDLVVSREIQWAFVFPLLAVGGMLLALLRVPWSPVIFLLAPVIMAVLYWKDPEKRKG